MVIAVKRITAVILALVLCASGACFAGNSASAWPGFCCLAPGEMPIGFPIGFAVSCDVGQAVSYDVRNIKTLYSARTYCFGERPKGIRDLIFAIIVDWIW